MKKIILLILLLISSCILLGLVWFSNTGYSNSFIRVFPPHVLGILDLVDLPADRYYLAGITDSTIYLGAYSDPIKVIQVRYGRGPTQLSTFYLPRTPDQKISIGTRIQVSYPSIYLFDAIWSSVLAGFLHADSLQQFDLSNQALSRSLALAPSNYIITEFDTLLGVNKLVKVISGADSVNAISSYPLEKQVDGFFCTQGTLSYDYHSSLLFFVYQYRNEILALDSNLSVQLRARTIDQVSHAQIQIDTIVSGDVYKATFKSPPALVNRSIYASYPYLFVNSELLSDNEDILKFNESSVIDVYNQENGDYVLSFYLPHFKGVKLSDFIVHNQKVFALHGTSLLIYSFTY